MQTDKETKVFNKFVAKSKKKRSQQQESESPDHPEELYNIDEEIELLKEIKDIQDELHILLVLLETQDTVLEQAAEAMSKRTEFQDTTPKSPRSHAGITGSSKPGQEAPYSSTFHFKKLHQMVADQEKKRKTLQVQAEAANKAVSKQLSYEGEFRLITTAQSPLGLEAEAGKCFRSKICKVDRRIYKTTGQYHGFVHTCDYHFREYPTSGPLSSN